ncbi:MULTISPECIES: RNA-binding protein [unclassified Mucilaginibacter]|uniref:RNA recognition motif domain-containing protein n=1 Tax=unclassified Mucilaginibacter TaxID=2617802 RepID=UPI0031F61090
MTKLFISGFPLEISEMDLAKLIAPHGDIATIKIVRDKQTRKCKGYAFIEMESLDDAENTVIALDGERMGDRELTVKISEDKPVAPKPRFSRPPTFGSSGNNKPGRKPFEEQEKRPRRPRA